MIIELGHLAIDDCMCRVHLPFGFSGAVSLGRMSNVDKALASLASSHHTSTTSATLEVQPSRPRTPMALHESYDNLTIRRYLKGLISEMSWLAPPLSKMQKSMSLPYI